MRCLRPSPTRADLRAARVVVAARAAAGERPRPPSTIDALARVPWRLTLAATEDAAPGLPGGLRAAAVGVDAAWVLGKTAVFFGTAQVAAEALQRSSGPPARRRPGNAHRRRIRAHARERRGRGRRGGPRGRGRNPRARRRLARGVPRPPTRMPPAAAELFTGARAPVGGPRRRAPPWPRRRPRRGRRPRRRAAATWPPAAAARGAAARHAASCAADLAAARAADALYVDPDALAGDRARRRGPAEGAGARPPAPRRRPGHKCAPPPKVGWLRVDGRRRWAELRDAVLTLRARRDERRPRGHDPPRRRRARRGRRRRPLRARERRPAAAPRRGGARRRRSLGRCHRGARGRLAPSGARRGSVPGETPHHRTTTRATSRGREPLFLYRAPSDAAPIVRPAGAGRVRRGAGDGPRRWRFRRELPPDAGGLWARASPRRTPSVVGGRLFPTSATYVRRRGAASLVASTDAALRLGPPPPRRRPSRRRASSRRPPASCAPRGRPAGCRSPTRAAERAISSPCRGACVVFVVDRSTGIFAHPLSPLSPRCLPGIADNAFRAGACEVTRRARARQ